MDSEEHLAKSSSNLGESPVRSDTANDRDEFPFVEGRVDQDSPADSWVQASYAHPSPFLGSSSSIGDGGGDISSAISERDALRAELNKAQRSLAASQGSSTNLISQIGNKESECDAHRKQIDQLVSTMDSDEKKHEETVTELIEEITELKGQLASARSVVTVPNTGNNNDLEASIEVLKEELEKSSAECDELRAQLVRTSEQLQEVKTQREVDDALVADLSLQLEVSKAELQAVKDANAHFLFQLQNRSDELEVVSKGEFTKSSELEMELATVKKQLLFQAQQAEKKSIANDDDISRDLQIKIDDLTFQLSTSSAQVNALVEEKKSADTRLSELTKNLELLQTQYDEETAKYQSTVADLEVALKGKESNRQLLEYELVRVKTMLEDANGDNSAEAEKSSELQKQLEEVKAQLQAAEEAAELSMASRAQLMEDNNTHSLRINDLVHEIEVLQLKLNTVEGTTGNSQGVEYKVAVEKLLQSGQLEISVLFEKIEELRDTSQAEVNALREQKNALQKQLESLRQHAESVSSRTDTLRDALEQDLRVTRDDLKFSQIQLINAESEVASCRDQIADLNARLSASQTELVTLTTSTYLEILQLKSALLQEQGVVNELSSSAGASTKALDVITAQHNSEIESLHLKYREKLSAIEADCVRVSEQLAASNQHTQELESALAIRGEENEKTREDAAATVLSLEQICESLRNQMQSLNVSQDTDRCSEVERLKEKFNDEVQLHEQLQLAIHDELATFKAKYEDLTAEFERLRELNFKQRKELAETEEHVRVTEESREQLLHDLITANDKCTSAERQLSQLTEEKQLLLDEIETLRSCPPPPPPAPMTPIQDGRDQTTDDIDFEFSPMADYSGFGDDDNAELEEIAKLRSALHGRNAEVGRLQDLYIDVCSKFEDVQSELNAIKARQEVGALSVSSGGDSDIWLGELIQAKMLAANTASELDMQRKKANSLQKNIVLYSDRITKLETELIAAKEASNNNTEKSKLSKRLSVKGFKLPGTGKKDPPAKKNKK